MERNGFGRGSMIVVDGVYSMEGNIADVPGPGAGGPEVRRRPRAGRRPRPRRARAQRRRHGGALRPDRRGGHHRRHLLQVAGVHRRVRGGVGERHPLPEAPQPAAHLHRLAAPGQHGRRARRARSAPERAGAPRPAVGQHPPAAGRLPQPRVRHRADPDPDRAGADRSAGEDLPDVAPAVRRRACSPTRWLRPRCRRPSAGCAPASWRRTRSTRSTSPWSSSPASAGTWGSSDPTAARPRGAGPTGPQALHRPALPTPRAGPDLGPAVASGRRGPPLPHQEPVLRARRGRVFPRRAGRRRGGPHRGHHQSPPQRDPRRPGRASSASSSASTTRRWPTPCSTPRPSGAARRVTTCSAAPPRSR